MSESKGGGSYGFAPRGDPVRRHVDRHAPASASRTSARPQPPPPPPIAPIDHRDHSSKLPWTWLLIGLLLGVGGTLMTSTLWLPEQESRDLVDTSADGPEPSTSGEAVAATGGPTVADPEELERDPDEDAVDGLEVVAVDPEITIVADDVSKDGFSADSEDLSDLVQPADTSEPQPEVDISSPSGEEAVIDQTDEPSVAADPLTPAARPEEPLSDPEEALEALTSAGAKSLEDDPVGENAGNTADTVERPQPAPAVVAERVTDDDAAPAAEPPQTDLAGPSNDAEPVDLPSRIRQALQRAAAESDSPSDKGDSTDRVYRVQLAAVNDEAAAQTYWREVNERLPGVFDDVEPVFDQRLVDERLYLRIWVGAFDSRVDALGYCDWLKELGQECFVTRANSL